MTKRNYCFSEFCKVNIVKRIQISMNSDASEKVSKLFTSNKKTKAATEELKDLLIKNNKAKTICSKKYVLTILIGIFLIICIWWFLPYINEGECLLEIPPDISKIFRPPENCNFCHGVKRVERVSDITPLEFEKKFAYNSKPVIITDATKNWTALDVFDFYYFKNLYFQAKQEGKNLNCQFFPYKSGFRSLLEAFSIPDERVKFKAGTEPWYIGWSNCNSDIAEVLRKHYGRPKFLPHLSENAATDWIFMGGSGLGAHMHVDNVRLPSWQAQIKGSKEWIIAPPPECYFECDKFKTVMKTGDIIVLDTNKWYHQTNVLPGELSITIGAEYD